LLHPRYGLARLYEAEVAGNVRRADLDRWRRGLTLDDGPAIPLAVWEALRARAAQARGGSAS